LAFNSRKLLVIFRDLYLLPVLEESDSKLSPVSMMLIFVMMYKFMMLRKIQLFFFYKEYSWVWWCMPKVPATQKAETEGLLEPRIL
jgi:hypothetical protein